MSQLKTYIFKVEMECEGCSKAITNVLNKHKDQGISKFDVNLPNQAVTVESTMSSNAVFEILKKTGKNVELLEEKKK